MPNMTLQDEQFNMSFVNETVKWEDGYLCEFVQKSTSFH